MVVRTSLIKTRSLEYTQEAEALIRKKDKLVRSIHQNFLDYSEFKELVEEERSLIRRINIETKEVLQAIELRIEESSNMEFLLRNIRRFYRKIRGLFTDFLRIIRKELIILKKGQIGGLDKLLNKELEIYYKIERAANAEMLFLKTHDLIKTIALEMKYAFFYTLKSPMARVALSGWLIIASANAQQTFHITKRGDTWYGLGTRYGLDYRWLAKANGMDPNAILPVGVKLRLPGKVAEKKQAEKPKQKLVKATYVVQPKDNPYAIARKFGISLAKLKELNKKRTLKVIFPGDKLVVLVPEGTKQEFQQEEKKEEEKVNEEIKYDFQQHYVNRAPIQPDKKEWKGIAFRTAAHGVTKYNNHPAILIEFYFLNNLNEYNEFTNYENYILGKVNSTLADFMAKTGFNTLILDAGHGGRDGGAVNPELGKKESTETLKIAKKIERLAKALGANVLMTRTTDTYLGINARWKKYKDVPGAIFVSIHLNSATRKDASGYEVYCYDPEKDPKKGGNRNPSRIILSESLAAYVTYSIDNAMASLPTLPSNLLAKNP